MKTTTIANSAAAVSHRATAKATATRAPRARKAAATVPADTPAIADNPAPADLTHETVSAPLPVPAPPPPAPRPAFPPPELILPEDDRGFRHTVLREIRHRAIDEALGLPAEPVTIACGTLLALLDGYGVRQDRRSEDPRKTISRRRIEQIVRVVAPLRGVTFTGLFNSRRGTNADSAARVLVMGLCGSLGVPMCHTARVFSRTWTCVWHAEQRCMRLYRNSAEFRAEWDSVIATLARDAVQDVIGPGEC